MRGEGNTTTEEQRLQRAVSIEQGYFVFTLMPSLRCSLNCPHCYLSLDQRRNSPIMALPDLELACSKVDAYYRARRIERKTIVCYWYGGEPTEMGQDYFTAAADSINAAFAAEAGYTTRHVVLTSLLTVDPSWYPIFRRYGDGGVQTSFDGLMRGANYVRRWKERVGAVIDFGLRLSTISVVNHEMLREGPEAILDYLSEARVFETSFLPFMWNEQNDGEKYERYAPRMEAYSAFMIRLSEHWLKRRRAVLHAPFIGQMSFILGQSSRSIFSNIAGQTLFLLPDGDCVLPDYRNGYQEFLRPFGNILKQDFESILTSPARRAYLRRQVLRNNNPECRDCAHIDKCIMEFWKDNRAGDDCFGAKRYVEWVLAHEADINLALGREGQDVMLY